MPKPPPRPLRLPDLVSDPQARAEYIEAHPAIHSPFPSPSILTRSRKSSSNTPPSPSSTTDVDSRRTSSAMPSSPLTPASTRTSLSVHNAAINEPRKAVSGLSDGLIPNDGVIVRVRTSLETKKPRALWEDALANTRSWFGGSTAAENKNLAVTELKKSVPKEIKLSPSMITANAGNPPSNPASPRPLSSPYPYATTTPTLSPTGSTFSLSRTPRVGSGLRYYTERNPAPTQSRVQTPDLQDHDSPRPALSHLHDTNDHTVACDVLSKRHTVETRSPHYSDGTTLEDNPIPPRDIRGPPSPPPTPPMNISVSDGHVPDIRVSSGDA